MTKNNLQIIEDIIKKSITAGASSADAVCFTSSDVSVSIRLGVKESIERSESCGFGLRVMIGQKQAMVSSNDNSDKSVDELVERAIAMARISPEDKYSAIAEKTILADINNIPDLDLFDDYEPAEELLFDVAMRVEDVARSVKGITNSEGGEAGHSKADITLATSNGFIGNYKSSMYSFSTSVIAGDGTAMERDYELSSARHWKDLEDVQKIGRSAAERALKRLNPKRAKTGKFSVVFDKRVSKGLVSSFASAINGASIARGTSFLKNNMGQSIFGSNINIINDPHIKRGLSSKPYDAEGVANKKIHLIKDGELQEWLLDIRSANQLGLKTNGCASRGLDSAPSPSYNNLYMKQGLLSTDELISDIKSGFYVTETFGMGVNIVTGDYSQGAAGFWIENGKITYPVSEVTIAGTLQEMFKSAVPANDLEFRYVVNCPTLRIDGMTVAGG